MSCARCGGLLVNEFIVDPIEGSHSGFHGQRCLNCGTIVDEVIGENRTLSLSRERHPVKSRPRFRFVFTNIGKAD